MSETNAFRQRAIGDVYAIAVRAERLQPGWVSRIYASWKRCSRVYVHDVVKRSPILPEEHGKPRLAVDTCVIRINGIFSKATTVPKTYLQPWRHRPVSED